MKVLAINTSPRAKGNTAAALGTVLEKVAAAGHETEFFQMGGKLYSGCRACGQCRSNKNGRCIIESDDMNDIIAKMVEADAILIGSPTYFSNMTTECKALIDRAGYATRGGGNLLKRKVGAAVVSARRAGSNVTFAGINYFFTISEMPVVSSSYWNQTLSGPIGDYANDAEGIGTMEKLGENLLWMLEKLKD